MKLRAMQRKKYAYVYYKFSRTEAYDICSQTNAFTRNACLGPGTLFPALTVELKGAAYFASYVFIHFNGSDGSALPSLPAIVVVFVGLLLMVVSIRANMHSVLCFQPYG